MKIGGTYLLHEIDRHHWDKWAVEASLPPERVTALVVALIRHVVDSLEPTLKAVAEMNNSPFLETLTHAISGHTERCAKVMERWGQKTI